MTQLYELIAAGIVPVSLAEIKLCLRITSTADDAALTQMLSAATTWGEEYTGQAFRANTWQLLLDEFTSRIKLQKPPVDSITSVEHLVSNALVTVPPSTYYLKRNTQSGEILLSVGQDWPTDTDLREQGIDITFVTTSYRDVDAIATAIKRHVTYWYSNKGDCTGGSGGGCTCDAAAKGSGVTSLYAPFRIDRV